jgi:hypothetical protein
VGRSAVTALLVVVADTVVMSLPGSGYKLSCCLLNAVLLTVLT